MTETQTKTTKFALRFALYPVIIFAGTLLIILGYFYISGQRNFNGMCPSVGFFSGPGHVCTYNQSFMQALPWLWLVIYIISIYAVPIWLAATLIATLIYYFYIKNKLGAASPAPIIQ